jgi:hypothetical protein
MFGSSAVNGHNALRPSTVAHGSSSRQNAVFNHGITDVLVGPQTFGEFLL